MPPPSPALPPKHAIAQARGKTRSKGNLPARQAAVARRALGTIEATPLPADFSLRKWSYGTGEPMPDGIQTFVPLGHPAHYRIHPSEEFARGHFEFCGLNDGFFVHVSDITHVAPYRLSVSAPDILRVRIASHDDCDYIPAAEGGDMLSMKGPGAAVIIEPAGQPAADAVFDGHSVAAILYIHRGVLQQLYQDREQELPAPVQAFVAGTLDRTIARHLPLGPALLRCLEDLIGCTLGGHGRRLFFRSKAIEILCHAFDALGQEDPLALADASAPTRRGVLKAQQILNEQFVAPPSLDDLAHDVGLSRSGLCTGFRQIVGLTVFDYVAELRMRQALTLLVQRDASITQIAFDVGFSHPSSFSMAVQRRFGSTPSELRRRGLPGI